MLQPLMPKITPQMAPKLRFQAAGDPNGSVSDDIFGPVKSKVDTLPGDRPRLESRAQQPDSYQGSVEVTKTYRVNFPIGQEKFSVDLEPDGSIIRAFRWLSPDNTCQRQFPVPLIPHPELRQRLTDYLQAVARYMHDPKEVSPATRPNPFR